LGFLGTEQSKNSGEADGLAGRDALRCSLLYLPGAERPKNGIKEQPPGYLFLLLSKPLRSIREGGASRRAASSQLPGQMDGAGHPKRRPLGVMASSSSSSSTLAAARVAPNPLAELTDRIKSLEAGLRMWLAKQPTHVEAAVSTALGAVQGGALGGLMGTLAPDGGSGLPMPQPPPGVDPKATASFKQAQVRPFFPCPVSLPSQEH
jgi:hypothetical protein